MTDSRKYYREIIMGAFEDMMKRVVEITKTTNKEQVMNTYKFKTGLVAKGTLKQIQEVADALGETIDWSKMEGTLPKGFYVSKTKGIMKLSEMATPHLKNAIIARSKEVLESLRKRKLTEKEFLNEFVNLGNDTVINDLFYELKDRK